MFVIVVDFCSILEPIILYCFVGILAGKEAKKQSSKIQTLAMLQHSYHDLMLK